MDSQATRPLRIWIVDPIDYSGMAYYDAGMADGLARAGGDVWVIGTDRRLVPPPARASWRHAEVFKATAGGGPRVARGLRYLLSVLRLLRLARRHRPDVVVWQYPEVQLADLFAMRMLRRLGTRIAFVAHELEPWSRTRTALAARRWIVRYSDLLVSHGASEADALADRFGVPRARVLVAEHGDYRAFVDLSITQAAARARLGLDRDAPIALLFGSLRVSKGISVLVDVWPSVLARIPDACLVIAGRQPHGTDIQLSHLEGAVVRSGTISPEAANDYYAACDVVAMPYDEITTSGVLRHAYSAGRAVVATGIGELRRHVVPGETGWIVAAGDRDGLLDAIVESLSDRGRTATMGERALAYANATFDWTTIGASTYKALRGLV